MWRKIAAIFTALYLCFLVLCSSTLFWQGPVAELFAKLARTVPFEEGVVSKDADTVILKLHEGETALLAELPNLRSADFSGSDNLQEILDWAAANPQVSVMYDVALPDELVQRARTHTVGKRAERSFLMGEKILHEWPPK